MKKKNIEIIINNLIEKVLETGKKPGEIALTQERYDELCNKLDEIKEDIYEQIPNGFVYHDFIDPIKISKYKGISVRVGSKVRIISY